MHKATNWIVLALVLVVCVSFFLPWVSVESKIAGGISGLFGGHRGDKGASLKQISGFEVPILANGPDARLMLGIAQLINPSVTDVNKKSYLVYAIPLLAIVMFLASLFWGANRWVNLGLGIIGAGIFIVTVFKIQTTNLDKIILNVRIAAGLWLILWAYLIIGFTGILRFINVLK